MQKIAIVMISFITLAACESGLDMELENNWLVKLEKIDLFDNLWVENKVVDIVDGSLELESDFSINADLIYNDGSSINRDTTYVTTHAVSSIGSDFINNKAVKSVEDVFAEAKIKDNTFTFGGYSLRFDVEDEEAPTVSLQGMEIPQEVLSNKLTSLSYLGFEQEYVKDSLDLKGYDMTLNFLADYEYQDKDDQYVIPVTFRIWEGSNLDGIDPEDGGTFIVDIRLSSENGYTFTRTATEDENSLLSTMTVTFNLIVTYNDLSFKEVSVTKEVPASLFGINQSLPEITVSDIDKYTPSLSEYNEGELLDESQDISVGLDNRSVVLTSKYEYFSFDYNDFPVTVGFIGRYTGFSRKPAKDYYKKIEDNKYNYYYAFESKFSDDKLPQIFYLNSIVLVDPTLPPTEDDSLVKLEVTDKTATSTTTTRTFSSGSTNTVEKSITLNESDVIPSNLRVYSDSYQKLAISGWKVTEAKVGEESSNGFTVKSDSRTALVNLSNGKSLEFSAQTQWWSFFSYSEDELTATAEGTEKLVNYVNDGLSNATKTTVIENGVTYDVYTYTLTVTNVFGSKTVTIEDYVKQSGSTGTTDELVKLEVTKKTTTSTTTTRTYDSGKTSTIDKNVTLDETDIIPSDLKIYSDSYQSITISGWKVTSTTTSDKNSDGFTVKSDNRTAVVNLSNGKILEFSAQSQWWSFFSYSESGLTATANGTEKLVSYVNGGISSAVKTTVVENGVTYDVYTYTLTVSNVFGSKNVKISDYVKQSATTPDANELVKLEVTSQDATSTTTTRTYENGSTSDVVKNITLNETDVVPSNLKVYSNSYQAISVSGWKVTTNTVSDKNSDGFTVKSDSRTAVVNLSNGKTLEFSAQSQWWSVFTYSEGGLTATANGTEKLVSYVNGGLTFVSKTTATESGVTYDVYNYTLTVSNVFGSKTVNVSDYVLQSIGGGDLTNDLTNLEVIEKTSTTVVVKKTYEDGSTKNETFTATLNNYINTPATATYSTDDDVRLSVSGFNVVDASVANATQGYFTIVTDKRTATVSLSNSEKIVSEGQVQYWSSFTYSEGGFTVTTTGTSSSVGYANGGLDFINRVENANYVDSYEFTFNSNISNDVVKITNNVTKVIEPTDEEIDWGIELDGYTFKYWVEKSLSGKSYVETYTATPATSITTPSTATYVKDNANVSFLSMSTSAATSSTRNANEGSFTIVYTNNATNYDLSMSQNITSRFVGNTESVKASITRNNETKSVTLKAKDLEVSSAAFSISSTPNSSDDSYEYYNGTSSIKSVLGSHSGSIVIKVEKEEEVDELSKMWTSDLTTNSLVLNKEFTISGATKETRSVTLSDYLNATSDIKFYSDSYQALNLNFEETTASANANDGDFVVTTKQSVAKATVDGQTISFTAQVQWWNSFSYTESGITATATGTAKSIVFDIVVSDAVKTTATESGITYDVYTYTVTSTVSGVGSKTVTVSNYVAKVVDRTITEDGQIIETCGQSAVVDLNHVLYTCVYYNVVNATTKEFLFRQIYIIDGTNSILKSYKETNTKATTSAIGAYQKKSDGSWASATKIAEEDGYVFTDLSTGEEAFFADNAWITVRNASSGNPTTFMKTNTGVSGSVASDGTATVTVPVFNSTSFTMTQK